MPKQKKFKEKVRSRQERDGMSYSEARRIEGRNKAAPVQGRQDDGFEAWLRDNPGPHEIKLRLQHNEHGTPEVFVVVHRGVEAPVSFLVTQPPLVYAEAIRKGVEDAQWAKNPRDIL